MDKRKIRDGLRLAGSIIFFWLYLPHILLYVVKRQPETKEDLRAMGAKIKIKLPEWLIFLYLIHNDSYYRKIFYHRIGALATLLIGWWRPGNKYLVISRTMELGGGVELLHPFASVINAEKIGKNFSFRNGTVLGLKGDGRPTLGDNVTVGVNVCIIGDIRIGNNVFIGAGSVVVKDVPDNCVVVGNPARIVKRI